MPDLPPPINRRAQRASWIALPAIAVIAGTIALAFAWVGGWLSPDRLTPRRFADAIEKGNGEVYPGFRRAHAKGVCIAGYFEGNGDGIAVSSTRMFETVRTPFIGRMSVGGGSPYGLDNKARVRSMALELRSDDGQQWRMAMNSFPFFGVSSVKAFYEQTRANAPDPATGKPDPAKQSAFAEAHPEFKRFAAWAKDAPWSTSWASTTYNGVNTFRFINAAGEVSNVRWSMQPHAAFVAMTPGQRDAADGNFLSEDLQSRLAKGPLRWDMVVTVADEGDAILDASQPWPEARQHIVVGSVVMERTSPQTTGACRDINFDPLVLPVGVESSGDPVLAARSAVYSVSFNRRERDIASGKASSATGQVPVKVDAP